MSKPTMHPSLGERKLEPLEWTAFFNDFTRENRGAHARLEVIGGEVGYQVETENRPFNGVAADLKDGERTVWITFGSTLAEHITHGVGDVAAIYVMPRTETTGPVLEVEADDGTRSLLTLSQPGAYALPPRNHDQDTPRQSKR
jgi:uncharacterized protein DUF5335